MLYQFKQKVSVRVEDRDRRPRTLERGIWEPAPNDIVSWYFKPSQPQKIVSGPRETFIDRYIVERTSKAEIRPEEQSEKAESCRENSWDEIQLKGP